MRRSILWLLAAALAAVLVVAWRSTRPDATNPGIAAPVRTEPAVLHEPVELLEAARTPERTNEVAPEPAPASAEAARPDLEVRGRVVTSAGLGLAEVEVAMPYVVALAGDGGQKSVGSKKSPFARAATAGDGTFAFALAYPPAGRIARFQLACARTGYAPLERWVDVGEGDRVVEVEDLVLVRGTTLRGLVRDAAGAVVEGARVHVSLPTGPASWGGSGSSSVSRADGSFEIVDGPSGRCQVGAVTEDRTRGDPVELALEPGDTRDGIELVVPVRDDALAVSGIVLDVDGAPLANAPLQASHKTDNGSGGTTAGRRTGADGRFRFTGQQGAIFQISASHPRDDGSSALAADVPIGTHGLVLRLNPPVTSTLRVVNAITGAPIPRFSHRVRLELADMRRYARKAAHVDQPAGEAALPLPAERFAVEVDAPGFASGEAGPFDPRARPEVIEVRLDPLPALRGRVVRGDEPVAGALVRAQPELQRGESRSRQGFDLAAQPCEGCPATKTDAEGVFELDLRAPGAWYVRAESQGDASPLGGPAVVAVRGSAPELVIDLAPRGAIEGRARTASGVALSRRRVGASNGDGEVRTTTTDDGGAYRLDRLAPGPWQVRLFPQEPSVERGDVTRTEMGEAPPIRWDCRVDDGRTTRFDLVEAEPVELLVRIHDASGRFPPDAWSVRARPVDPLSKLGRASAKAPGEDGVFRLRLESGGEWSVSASLSGDEVRAQLTRVVAVADVRAETRFELGRGSVRGRVRPGSNPHEQVGLMGTTRDGVQVFVGATTRDDRTFEFPFGFEGTFTVDVPSEENRVVELKVTADEVADAGEF